MFHLSVIVYLPSVYGLREICVFDYVVSNLKSCCISNVCKTFQTHSLHWLVCGGHFRRHFEIWQVVHACYINLMIPLVSLCWKTYIWTVYLQLCYIYLQRYRTISARQPFWTPSWISYPKNVQKKCHPNFF